MHTQIEMKINITYPMGMVRAVSQLLDHLENTECKAQVLQIYFEDNPEVYSIMQKHIELESKED